MALYLGNQKIHKVLTTHSTTTTNTSDATATASTIQKGYTAYVNGTKITGTLQPAAANIKTGVTIAGVAGTFTSDATATAAMIQKNYTAYVNGAKITGTLAPAAANIKTGVTIAGVAGTFTSDGTATAAMIQRGYIAYSKGSKLTGTGPKIFYQTTPPSSGMSTGDIWIDISSSANTTSGTFNVTTPNSSYSTSFTEDIAYVTYARTLTGSCYCTCSGYKNGTTLNLTYTIHYTLNDPQTTNDYNATFKYQLYFIDSAGTSTTIVSSSKSSITHGSSGVVTANVSKTVANLDGYFSFTYTMSLPYQTGEAADTADGSPATATNTLRTADLFAGAPKNGSNYYLQAYYYTTNGWRG